MTVLTRGCATDQLIAQQWPRWADAGAQQAFRFAASQKRSEEAAQAAIAQPWSPEARMSVAAQSARTQQSRQQSQQQFSGTARIAPLSSDSYRVVFTASERLKQKLDRARELLSHVIPPNDLPPRTIGVRALRAPCARTMSLESLCHLLRSGALPEYLFFWGHTSRDAQAVGAECLSQWFPSPFMVEGRQFPTAEHYMMYGKARLFGDDSVAEQIIVATHPKAVKALGRKVRGFDQVAWESHRVAIVLAGNRAKFGSNPGLRRFLVETGKRVLVEASPVDRIWGIGLSADSEHARNPLTWHGQNLLGFALMSVRRELQSLD